MSLATDVQTLLARGWHYQREYGTLDLALRGAHDMVVGTTTPKKDPHYVYTDFHVHIHKDTDPRVMLREAAKRVDIVAITGRTEDFAHNHHTLDTFLEGCRQHKVNEIEQLGENVLAAQIGGKTLYLVRATEIYPAEMIGVVSVGGKLQKKYEKHGEGNLHDTIGDAKDHAAFWFIDHPFSIAAPVIAFRYPTKDEVKRRVEIFTESNAIIEIENHQNTWYMYLSNEIARRVAQENGFVGIGNSDTHFRVREIGLTRTRFPRDLLETSSEEKFLASLRRVFSQEHKDMLTVEGGVSSTWSFGNYMVLGSKIDGYDRLAVKYNF